MAIEETITPQQPQLPAYQQEMLDIINRVDEYSWNRGQRGGLTFGDENMDFAFDGLSPALYILAGQPNIGKSMLGIKLAWQVATRNPDAYVIYFSIDDPDFAILPRVIALDQELAINVAKLPERFRDTPEIAKREKGLTALKQAVNSFKLLDRSKENTNTIEGVRAVIKAHKAALDAAGEGHRKVCAFVDNLYDLKSDEKYSSKNELLAIVADKAGEICDVDQVPIFATGELKKLNGIRRPILDDLKDCIELQYKASAIMLCYNEVQLKGERAEVYHEVNGQVGKKPVLEVHVAKNKLSDYKGRFFYNMYPGFSYLNPVEQKRAQFYISKI
jgi:replicative DNA helicase